jgi:hypothetical protein
MTELRDVTPAEGASLSLRRLLPFTYASFTRARHISPARRSNFLQTCATQIYPQSYSTLSDETAHMTAPLQARRLA